MQQKKNLDEKERRKLANRRKTDIAYMFVFALIVVLLLISYIFLNYQGKFVLEDFIENILGNLMGVFAAFLIFDVIRDKLTQDTYAEEVSDQLLETLLSKEDAMLALDDDLRRKFIGNALKSLDSNHEAAQEISQAIDQYLCQSTDRKNVLKVIDTYNELQRRVVVDRNVELIVDDTDAADMIKHYLDYYLVGNNECRIRTSFSYTLELRDSLPEVFDILKCKEDYFYVQETLTYDVKYLSPKMNNVNSETVSIGFAYDNKNLDKFLRDEQKSHTGDPLKNCIFRESLDIDMADIEYFKSLSPEDLREQFSKMFRPHLTIDRSRGELIDVRTVDYGIIAEFKMEHMKEAQSHNIDIIFHMPKRWGGIIEIALVDPTKQPKISLSYQEDSMQVDMYSFLNKGDNSAYENTHESENGVYRILLNNEWVYPISGVVFTIDKQ